MKKTSFLVALAVMTVSTQVWAISDTQYDVLFDRVERMEREMMGVQRKIYSGSGINGSAPVPTVSLDGLYTQIDDQKAIIQELTTKIETLEFNQKQLEEKLAKMNADIDVRFNLLEKSGVKSSGTSTTSSSSSSKNGDAQVAYDKAYNAMKKGDYKTAEAGFTAFMKKYPKSDLVGNANYWLGETYYVRKQYEQAVGVFADGFTKYKNNSKAPDNLLKLGLSMKALKRNSDACTAFKELPTAFPKAPDSVKKRAKSEAQKLACK